MDPSKREMRPLRITRHTSAFAAEVMVKHKNRHPGR